MECEFSETVSALMDGELSAEDAGEVRQHLHACSACRLIEQDFLCFREQLRGAAGDIYRATSRNALAPPRSLWRTAISVPIPAFAAGLIVLLVLGIEILRWQGISGRGPVAAPAGETAKINAAGDSLSRYDTGGRAEVMVVARKEAVR